MPGEEGVQHSLTLLELNPTAVLTALAPGFTVQQKPGVAWPNEDQPFVIGSGEADSLLPGCLP